MKRKLLLFLLCVLCVTPFILGAQAREGNQDRTVTTMTRNMFPGADLGAVAAAQTAEEFELALQDTITSVIQSKIPERAALVAAEIAANKPDLETKLLQYVQALQLMDELSTTSLPIILAGDFNSDAEPTPG